MTVERSSKRPIRADAARNRARIIEAAREVFRARGLDVSLDDVARHAGVGVATLYRRFPDRESLIVAVFELRIQEVIAFAQIALAEPDAWTGFTLLLKFMIRSMAEDKGMRQHFLSSRYDRNAVAAARVELIRLLTMVIKRAQDDGELRPDLTPQDIPPLMLMVGVVADFTFVANPCLWERYCGLLIDGLSVRSKQAPLTPEALSASQMALTMSQW